MLTYLKSIAYHISLWWNNNLGLAIRRFSGVPTPPYWLKVRVHARRVILDLEYAS
jgi:hypothetical protein